MLKVKIADTPAQLEHGLMFVEHLPEDEGMLFVFKQAQQLSFWGRNTFIPLDIAFIDRNNRIEKISHIKPFCLDKVASNGICTMAIEANAGYFDENGIEAGQHIVIETDDWQRTASISFRKSILKESQMIPIGDSAPEQTSPMKPPTPKNPDPTNLPVIGPNELNDLLEDSFDEPELPEQEGLEEPQTEISPEKNYPSFSNAMDAADWAEKNGEVIRINYITRSGRQITRDVEPHGSFHADSTMRQILVTFDETVNDIRAFIFMNVKNWSFIGKQFQKKFIVRA
jgi:uncharacterized protein